MTKGVRRLGALALSLAMALSLFPPAAAAEGISDTTEAGQEAVEASPAYVEAAEPEAEEAEPETAETVSDDAEAMEPEAEEAEPETVETVSDDVEAVEPESVPLDPEEAGLDMAVEPPLYVESAGQETVTGLNTRAAHLFDADAAPVFQSGKSFGGEKTDVLQDVIYTQDGGFLVKGYSMGESSDPAWTHAGSGSNNDAILLKFDRDYNLAWSKAYGGDGVEVFEDVAELQDGRIAAIGRQSFIGGKEGAEVIKGVSWYLLLIDPDNPNRYEDYHIGGTAGDQGYGVAAMDDGGFVVAGWSASKAGYVTHSTDQTNYTDPVQLWEAQDGTDDALPNRVAASGSDSVVVRFDSAGEVVYTALHNYAVSEDFYTVSTPSERLTAMDVDSAGNIYLAGTNAIAKSVTNGFAAKLSGTDGSLLWHRSIGRNSKEMPANSAENITVSIRDLAVLRDDSVVLTGTATNDATTGEGWTVVGTKDILVLRYDGGSGNPLFAESFGTISDNASRPEGVTAAPDGGYLVCGAQSGAIEEASLTAKGYVWGNYGGQDAVLIRYDADNNVVWAKNYGTKNGDWFNGAAVHDDGEIIVVGESNGKYGTPAWINHGGLDGVIVCTNYYESLYTEPLDVSADGDVVWADGTYTASGDGFGGDNSVSATVVISDGKITSVTSENQGDTRAYYNQAAALCGTIVEKQSADVDGVSGATYSSNGIKEAASRALGKAAAAYVDSLTAAIEGAEDQKAATQAAADAYAELGTYSVSQLQNLEALRAAAEKNGVELLSRSDMAPEDVTPEPDESTELRHNDTYYRNQYEYYRLIDAEAFEDEKLTGTGVTIAVIDSGVTPSHSDLDYSRILPGYDYDNGKEMGTEENPYLDNNGHGTAVTGILAAITDNGIGVAGLLKDVKIVPLKVSPVAPDADTDGASSRQIAQVIRDAVDKYGADVITTSLSVKDTDELKEAVAYAASKNVLITGAAGNSSTSDADPYLYPASYEEVVSVGAVDAQGTVRANSQKNDQVFVTAPGEGIAVLDLSLSGRCKLANGTSYTSPVVAAMAAAAKQYDREMTTERFQELLKVSSTDAGAEGYDTSYGWGIVHFAAFANALLGRTAYVLMNIPYAEFYAAELGTDDITADAVTAATPKAYNEGITAGTYHNGTSTEGETPILGVTYPVFVSDAAILNESPYQQIDTEDGLFSAGDYAYYVLSEKPNAAKTLAADGTFSAVGGRSAALSDVEVSATVLTRRGDYELALEGADAETLSGMTVYGVILTTDSGANYPLRQLENIWNGTELALITGHTETIKDGALTPVTYEGLEGATVTQITYLVKDAEGSYRKYTIVCSALIPAYPTAAFRDGNTVAVSGLTQEDIEKALVQPEPSASSRTYFKASVHDGDTYLAELVNLNGDGTISLSSPAVSGTTYTVELLRYRERDGRDPTQDVLVSLNASYHGSDTDTDADEGTTYTVTFHSNGGSTVDSQTVTAGETARIPTVPIRSGFMFVNWYTDTGLTSLYNFNTPVNGNVDLYAKWNKHGCYVATAVYGSYDCPEVWTLRRFRDQVLAKTWYGRLFIHLYYAVSPTAVRLFGGCGWFQNSFRGRLDTLVSGLQSDGFASTPYEDRAW